MANVKHSEQIVFAEAARRNCTMLQIIQHVLYEDDSNRELLIACENVQDEIYKHYKKQIIADYLDSLVYKLNENVD